MGSGDAPDAKTSQVIRICYSSALSVMRQAIKAGKLDILYYLWDTSHLMVAYSAMIALKLLKHAPHVPEVSPEDTLDVIAELSSLHTAAAASLTSGSSAKAKLFAGSTSNAPAQNAVEVQARLLRAIVMRVRAELGAAASGIIENTLLNDGLMSDTTWSDSRNSSVQFDGAIQVPVDPVQAGASFQSERDGNFTVTQLVEDMDFTLDGSFVDERFINAGLLSWDNPGIFTDHR